MTAVLWELGFPDSSLVKNPPVVQETPVQFLERSSGEGIGYLLQYSGLENSMDRMVQEVARSWSRLSVFHFHFVYGN